MTLELENIGKIKQAKLDFNGLTVIVGDNNTGKSTMGKVLASLFTVLPTIQERVTRARRDYVFDEDFLYYGHRFRQISLQDFARLFDDENLTEKSLIDSLSDAWYGFPRPSRFRYTLEPDVNKQVSLSNVIKYESI